MKTKRSISTLSTCQLTGLPNLLLGAILIIAAVLRLIHPFAIPFTYDEMSAILRTHYSNISDEITKGVMLGDTHPAGVQVFLYYWTKLVGYSEIVVKLPFIVCGIFSVYYVFRLGKEWFNPTVGLVCAAYLATSQYTIMYSQIARPYISGLFFSLVMVWHWNKVVFNPLVTKNPLSQTETSQLTTYDLRLTTRYYQHLVLYILFSAMCAYNHHFSLLFAAMVGVTGLFFVRGKYLLKYVIAGVFIFVLYIPHLHIFFHQLSEGGVEDWLGKPHNSFIIQYIQYILQFSRLAYTLAGLLLLYSLFCFIKNYRVKGLTKFHIISISWFLIPFLVGFFYSKYVNAVIQYSVLIFSFPFMLYSAFGGLPYPEKEEMDNAKFSVFNSRSTLLQFLMVFAICSVNIFELVHSRKYYDIFYKSTFERQVLLNDSIYKSSANQQPATTIPLATYLSLSSPDTSITKFYLQKNHVTIPYTLVPDSSCMYSLIGYLERHKTTYLTYNYLGSSRLNFLPVILNYYPYINQEDDFNGGTNYVFSSAPDKGKNPYIFQSVNEFDKPCKYWEEAKESFLLPLNFRIATDSDYQMLSRMKIPLTPALLHSSTAWDTGYAASDTASSRLYYRMDSLHEWAPGFTCDLANMPNDRHNLILISLSLYPLEPLKDVEIVSVMESNGKQIHWSSTPVSDFISDTTRRKWVKAYHSIKLADVNINYPNVKLHVYIWNRGKKNFYMNNFGVRTMEGNPLIYWWVEKIDKVGKL